jgi:hypothetical protein
LTGRSEKSDGRDQIFDAFRANSRAICRKLSEIWADQSIFKPAHVKAGSLLGSTGEAICENKFTQKKSFPQTIYKHAKEYTKSYRNQTIIVVLPKSYDS